MKSEKGSITRFKPIDSLLLVLKYRVLEPNISFVYRETNESLCYCKILKIIQEHLKIKKYIHAGCPMN